MDRTGMFVLAVGSLVTLASSGPSAEGQGPETPRTRLRPIGAPSAVDRYVRSQPTRVVETAGYQAWQQGHDGPGRLRRENNAIELQQFQAPFIPPSEFSPGGQAVPGTVAPNNPSQPATPPGVGQPGSNVGAPLPQAPLGSQGPAASSIQPRSLPTQPAPSGLAPQSSSDLSPMIQPQLNNGGFATIDNCNCISAPSGYSAATGIDCGSPLVYNVPETYVAPPAQVPAPAVLPGRAIAPASSAPFGPLISLGQDRNPVEVGQGIIGQPVAYVPGQPVRNFIRYLFP